MSGPLSDQTHYRSLPIGSTNSGLGVGVKLHVVGLHVGDCDWGYGATDSVGISEGLACGIFFRLAGFACGLVEALSCVDVLVPAPVSGFASAHVVIS